ncbi:hypothetical protein GCM10028786_34310 [Flaviaesturariibacter terrae]
MLASVFLAGAVQAQSAANYAYSTGTNGSLATDMNSNSLDMSSGTTQLYGTGVDTYTGAVQTLPFTFYFMGQPYTQWSANPDGAIRLGSTAISSHTESASSGTAYLVLNNIDSKTDATSGKVHYKVFGSAPNRVLVVEWSNILINWNATGTTLSTFQARLYEATSAIEYVYGTMWNSSTTTKTDAIGFSSSNTAGTIGQLTTINTTPTYNTSATSYTNTTFAASAAMANLNSSADGSRRYFRFVPPAAPAAPTNLSFASVGTVGMTLNWTGSSPATGLAGYNLYSSTDNSTFTLVSTLTPATTSYTFTNESPATTYYYKIVAFSEGGAANALTGSQATAASAGTAVSTSTGGLWSQGSTWASGSVPGPGDNVTIADGATVSIDVSPVVNNLTVGQGTSGILQYHTVAAQSLTASGDVTIAPGATFRTVAPGSTTTLTNTLSLAGSLTNNGTINFSQAAGAGGTTVNATKVNVTFTGTTNANFDLGNAVAANFSTVTLNKGTSATPQLTFNAPANYAGSGANSSAATVTVASTAGLSVGMYVGVTGGTGAFATGTTVTAINSGTSFTVSAVPTTTLAGATIIGSTVVGSSAAGTGFLTISNGTLVVGGSNAYSTPLFSSASYTVPSTGGLTLNNANATITGQNGSPSFNGVLTMTAGTYNIGGATTTNSMSAAATTVWNINGGTINIANRFATSSAMTFNMSGGTINVATVGNSTSSSPSFGLTSTTTSFTMSGGTINLVQASTGTTQQDYNVAATSPNITGGTLNVGTAATATNFTFRIAGSFPALVLDNTTNNKNATLYAAGTAYGNTTINSGTTLNLNGFVFTERGTSVTNNGTLNGSTSGSRLSFLSTGAQTFDGSGTVTAPLDGLIVRSTGGLTINHASSITTLRVQLEAGTITNSNKLIIGNGGSTAATIVTGYSGNSGSGGFFDVAPTFNLGTGGLAISAQQESAQRTLGLELGSRSLSSLTINNSNGVAFGGGALSTGTLTLTAGKLATDATNLLTVSGTTAGSVSGGSATSYVSGPLVRTLPVSLATGSTYTFPVGKSGYNAFELVNPVTGASGTVTVQAEVFDANAGGSTGVTLSSLSTSRYWQVQVGNSANLTSTLVKLNDTRGSFDAIGSSSTVTGTYNMVGGFPATQTSTSLTSVSPTVSGANLGAFYLMAVTAPPAISAVTMTPNASTVDCNTSQPHTVTATITAGATLSSVVLTYRVNGGTAQNINMTNNGGGNYSATIPSVTPVNATVTWTISATDVNGLSTTYTGTSYQDAPLFGMVPSITASQSTICSGATVTLTASIPQAAFAETFETFPVTSFAVTSPLTATQSTTYFTQGASSVRLAYTANIDAAYTSSSINLTNYASATLTFSHILATETGLDYGWVQYSTDGGSTWTSFPTSSYSGSATLKNGVVSFDKTSYSDWAANFTSSTVVPTNALWKNETITIPAAALSSNQFRIRFRMTSDGSVQYYGWMIDNVVITGNRVQPNYFWSPGGETTSTPTLDVTPTSTTQYNVVAVDNNGCFSDVSGAQIVTVNQTPTAPSASNSFQCGTAVPTASVATTSGTATPSFRWYAAATGGSPLTNPNNGNAVITSATYPLAISSTTTYYVSEKSAAGCEGPRTALTVTVTSPDAVTASSNAAGALCPGNSVTLSVAQTGSTNHYTYTWTASPVSGSGIPTSVTGASVSVSPTAGGTYTYTVTAVDGTCTATSTVNVSVNMAPLAPTIGAAPAAICVGGSSVLTPTPSGSFANAFESANFPLNGFTVSSNATATQNSTYFAQGSSSVLFNTTSTSATATMAMNSNLDLSGYNSAKLTFSHQALMEGPSTSYDYGYVEYSNDGGTTWTTFPTSSYAGTGTLFNSAVSFSTMSYPDWIAAFTSSSSLPSNSLWKNETINIPASALTSQFRLRFRYTTDVTVNYYGWLIDNLKISAGADVASYTWSTGTTTTVASPSITVSPASTSTYTVTATDVNGCSSNVSTGVTVTVNPLPTAPTASNSTQCGSHVPTASVTSTTGAATPTFKWYDAASAGNLLQTSTSTTYTTAVSSTTTFYVAELNTTTGCESARTPVTITVNQPDAVTASGGATICLGTAANLSVAQTGSSNSYTYAWTASPASGSGIPSGVSGATATVTPTAAGTYVYTVTATDGTCQATSTVSITVNSPLSAPSLTASATTVCAGAPVVLTPAPGVTNTVAFESADFPLNGFTVSSNATATQNSTYFAQGSSSVLFNTTSTSATATMAMNSNLDLGNTASATLTFSHQALMEGPTTSYDYGYVEYSNDGGTTWTTFPTSSYVGTGTLFNSAVSFSTMSYPDWIAAFTSSASLPSNSLWKTETINIPAAALTSQFRLRFRYTTDVSTNYYGWLIDNVRISAAPVSYSWSTGATTTGASGPLTVNPTSTTTYSVQSVGANGCPSAASNTVTVTVNPLPTAPTASNSTQCGTAVPTASVASTSGLATPTFKWYDAASAGNLLQTSTSTTYTTAVNGTTTFYVAELNTATGCEGLRTAVTVTVNAPDAVSASANGPVCLGSAVNLTATQTGSTNHYAYTWTASPVSGSGIATSVAGATASVTPTAAGTYVYTVTAVDGTCATTSTISVTVNPNPSIATATATPASVCPGGTVALSGTSSAIVAGTVTIGSGATTTSTYNAPFYSLWSNKRMQILYRASELTAANLRAGNITALRFPTTSGTTAIQNVTIKMANTSSTDVTAFLAPSFTTVFTAASLAQTANSDNRVALATPFNWDGTSNVVIEICFYNPSSTATLSSTSPADVTSFTSVIKNNMTSTATASTVCGNSTNSVVTYTTRPKVIFEGQLFTDITSNYTWTWNPGNLSGASVVATVPGTPGTVTYTAKASNGSTGCFSTQDVTVSVGSALVVTTSSTPPAICVGGSATIAANVTGGGAPYTYSWKDANNTVVGTTQSISVTPAATSTYTVTVSDFCNTSASQTITVTVNPLPTVSITPSTTTNVCASSQNLTSSTSAASPAYQWLLNNSNIGAATGAAYSATATGNYSLKVTDGVTGCVQTSAATTVNLLPYPASLTATPATTTTICLGSSQTLTSSATLQNNTVPSASILAENFNGAGPYNFSVVNGTMTNLNGQWTVRATPYTYSTNLTNVTIDGTNFILANTDAAGSGSTTQTRLVSNAFSTAGLNAAVINFKHFARSGGTMIVEYSTNGSTWTAFTNGDFSAGTTGATTTSPTITSTSLNFPAGALNQPSVQVRFRYDAGWSWYWGVDDIQILGTPQAYYAWSSGTGAGLTTPAQTAAAANNSISVTPTAAGTYTYTVTASVPGNSCTNTTTVTLNVLTPSTTPAMLNSSVSTPTCPGSNVILTQTGGTLGDGAHWQWYKDAAFTQTVGGALSSANAQITVTPTTTTTYYLRAEGGTAPCASTVAASGSVTVSVRAALTASITAQQPVLCSTGLSASLNISGGPANGTVTVTSNGANPRSVTLDASGNGTMVSDPLSSNTTFAVTSVTDGVCAATTTASTTVYVGVLMANQNNNPEVCGGTTVAPIVFTGNFPAGTQYNWSSSNTAVGLAQASGTGTQLPSFTAVNNGSSSIYTDITVTPIISNSECKVQPMRFRIFVKPSPSINGVGSQTVCAGTMTSPVAFSSSVPTATFNWTNSNPAIGITSAGGGNLPAFLAQNSTGSSSITGTFTVTPVAGGCSGTPTTFTISVNSSANSVSYANGPFCQAGSVNPTLLGTRGGTFSASPAGLSINASTGQITLNSSAAGLYTVTYSPPTTAGGCNGPVQTQVRIKPVAVATGIANQVTCQGVTTNPIALTGTATSYNWTNDNPAIGLAASGSGTSLPSFVATNPGPTSIYGTIRVTPVADANVCAGKPMSFRYTVSYCAPVTQAVGTSGGSVTARIADQVVVGPNPATSRVTVSYRGTDEGPFTVQLITQYGQAITKPATFTGSSYTMDLTGLTPGVYVLQFINPRTQQTVQKQIVKL